MEKPKILEAGETSRGRVGERCQAKLSSCARLRAWVRVGKKGKISRRIAWADEVGGELLEVCSSNEEEETCHAFGKRCNSEHEEAFIVSNQTSKLPGLPGGLLSGEKTRGVVSLEVGSSKDEETVAAYGKGCTRGLEEAFTAGNQTSKPRGSPGGLQNGGKSRGEGEASKCSTPIKASYKEVLQRRSTPNPSVTNQHLHHLHPSPSPPPPNIARGSSSRRPVKRCFRCLATDHSVAVCRDPLRCFRCKKTSHRAKFCRETP